jgi:V/A-type H+-transporting ATPase subunit A
LQRERELEEIVQLVGADALAEVERGDLAVGRILREDFLQQSAFGDDAFCPPEKTYWLLQVILTFYDHLAGALRRAVPLERARAPDILDRRARLREWPPETAAEQAQELLKLIQTRFSQM